jgi:hypothetical protein
MVGRSSPKTRRPLRSFRPNVFALRSSTTRRLLNTRAGVVRRTSAAEFLDTRSSCRKFVAHSLELTAKARRRQRQTDDTKHNKTCQDKGQGHHGKRVDGLPTIPLVRQHPHRRIRWTIPWFFFFFSHLGI